MRSSCCDSDSDSDVHHIVPIQGGGPSRVERSPLNMHFMARRSHLKTPTGKWLNSRPDVTLDFGHLMKTT